MAENPAPKGPLSYVHECVEGCLSSQASPGANGDAGKDPTPPPATAANGGQGFQPSFPGQPQFPGQIALRPKVTVMLPAKTGPNGEQIFFHPHYPELKADICKGNTEKSLSTTLAKPCINLWFVRLQTSCAS